jgi:hypothetical protein
MSRAPETVITERAHGDRRAAEDNPENFFRINSD